MTRGPRETLGYRGSAPLRGNDKSRLLLHCIVAAVSWIGAAFLLWSATLEFLIDRRMGTRVSAMALGLGLIGVLLLAVALKFTWKIVRFRS